VVTKDGVKFYLADNDAAKVIVPNHLRALLSRQRHLTLCHLGHAKVHSSLAKDYYWPGMAAPVKKVLAECEECALNKATRNLSHGLWRSIRPDAPFTIWGIDFSPIPVTSRSGNKIIFLAMDMYTRTVELKAIATRDAKTAAEATLDCIVYRYGRPTKILSDHAKEFFGEVGTYLKTAVGYNHLSTGGYNPRSAGMIERFNRVKAEYFRSLSDEQFKDWDAYLPEPRSAQPASSLPSSDISPFELSHGLVPRLPSSPPSLPAVHSKNESSVAFLRDYMERAKGACTAIRSYAHLEDNAYKTATQDRLNSRGTRRTFRVTDDVMVYAPVLSQRGKYRKLWRRATISDIHNNIITTRLTATDAEVTRHLNLVRPFPSASDSSTSSQLPIEDEFTVGEIIARIDEHDEYWLAKIIDLTEDEATAQLFIRDGSGVYRPAYHEANGDCIVFRKSTLLYTWTFSPLPDKHIVARRIELSKSGRLAATAKRALALQRPGHH
jgi:hypothetical protein